MSKNKFNSLLAEGERVTAEELATERRVLQMGNALSRVNRRSFLSTLAVGAGAVGVLGMAGCSDDGTVTLPPTAPSGTPSVVDVLNFALNLEYFEANFYSYIANGVANPTNGSGAGTITGGAQLTFTTSAVQQIAQNLATEESQHVAFLQQTIAAVGGTAVTCPALNLAALGAVTSEALFAGLARTIEGVGVSAYIGGAQYLASSVPAINYAAQILQTEAQHSGALRQVCSQYNYSSPAADSYDQPPPSSNTTAAGTFNTGNTTGLNPVRTTQQVLGIVYGVSTASTTTPAAGVVKGGFFPNGLNGNIVST